MKILLIIVALSYTISNCYSQQTAITTEGKKVYLYDNGTWKYQDLNKIIFSSNYNNSGSLRLYITINRNKYDIGKWYQVNRNGSNQIVSVDFNNKKDEDYEAYAQYSNTSGYTVRYYAVLEDNKVKIYKYVFHNIMPEEETILEKVIKL